MSDTSSHTAQQPSLRVVAIFRSISRSCTTLCLLSLHSQSFLRPSGVCCPQYAKQSRANDKHMMARIYGSHLPIRLHMEEKLLTRFRRFPTLHSSHIGLETVLGVESEMEFGDYLNRPEESEKVERLGAHELMERRLGDKPDRG